MSLKFWFNAVLLISDFMTLSSLTPFLSYCYLSKQRSSFSNMSPLHPDMPCFTSQYAVFRTAKVAYRITILLFMRVVLSALFVVNAVLVSVFFIENKKQAKSKDRFSLLFNNNECFTAQVQPDNGRSRISRCGCLQILFFCQAV